MSQWPSVGSVSKVLWGVRVARVITGEMKAMKMNTWPTLRATVHLTPREADISDVS